MLGLEKMNGRTQQKRKKTSKTPEGKVKDRIREALDQSGAYWFMPVTGGYNRSGVPDFIACLSGKFIAIEAKSKFTSHGITKLQEINLNKISSCGGISLVINEDNINKLIDELNTIKSEL